MSLQVVPKRWSSDRYPRVQHIDGAKAGVVVECEAVYPPSRVGQSVTLHLDAEDVTNLLLELRDAARKARL